MATTKRVGLFASLSNAVVQIANAVGTAGEAVNHAAEGAKELALLAKEHAQRLRAENIIEMLKDMGIEEKNPQVALVIWAELTQALGSEEQVLALIQERKAKLALEATNA